MEEMTKEYSNKERQESELQALQAIFMDDIQDLRKKKAWNVWHPLELQIKLLPQQSMSFGKEINVQADLYVKCTLDYPNDIPNISIKNAKGLSLKNVSNLEVEVLDIARKLKGEVMILELAQHVQKFLHDYNKPQFKSFYEEMIFRLKNEKAMALKQEEEYKKLKEEREFKAIQEEIQRKQEALKKEARRRKIRQSSIGQEDDKQHCEQSLEDSSVYPCRDTCSPLRNVSDCCTKSHNSSFCKNNICSQEEVSSLVFHHKGERIIQRGCCLGHSQRGCVVYAGLDKSTGEFVVIKEWSLKLRQLKSKPDFEELFQKELSSYLKQISSIEQEFKSLAKLHHNNLVHYIGLRYIQEKSKITIHVLEEYVAGCTLVHFLSQGIPLSLNLLRHYGQGILEVLHYLHENSVVHKNLRDTSVFISSCGHIKVADYSLDRRLYDLYKSFTNEDSKDSFPPALGRGGKKGDIYRLGILLLSLSNGHLVKDPLPTIPSSLNPDFRDFLNKCLLHDEQRRWNTQQLLSHPFLSAPIQHNLFPKDAELKEEEEEEEEERDPSLPSVFASGAIGNSRLHSEFEIIKYLGSGGFGYVLKVRNKLDRRIYALKQIPLNPSSKQLNRKIKREVKLLSRLNHENIVRYYNSWIDTTDKGPESISSSALDSKDSPTLSKKMNITLLDNIERDAPPEVEDLQWNLSYECSSHIQNDDSSDDDDDDVFGLPFFGRSDHSDSIIFENDKESYRNDTDSPNNTKSVNNPLTSEQDEEKSYQYMYIQMEFCEKSTLRTAIDGSLYKEAARMWRLFREIIEGLVHIHQQGIIHRDLKPVNIFLDCNDHVKIGDFGLATTDIISRATLIEAGSAGDGHQGEIDLSHSEPFGDGSLTGRVGTALYVAPELATANASKTVYTQRVDIFSLGIILFEMCYPTPSTEMERVKVLINLRLPDVILPPDAEDHLSTEQIHLIKWLLQHDATKRPSSVELLSSEYLPPLQMEEAELNDMLRYTVSNPQSKAYKHMISSLFQQNITPAADFTYDMDVHKCQPLKHKLPLAFRYVTDSIQKIMHKHGAICVSVPTLMPKSTFYGKNDTCVHVMDHGGGIVLLPHDLRVPFARYIARREITLLKRYALEKVYRQHKVFGFHPREQYEFSFDIVTPTASSFFPDAEVLTVVSEIISEFAVLTGRNYYIRLNHASLLKAVLLHCGITEEKHFEIFGILNDPLNKTISKMQIYNQLTNLNLSDQAINTLYKFIEVEDSLPKVSSLIHSLTKRKGHISSLVKRGLYELETISSIVSNFDIKCPILISLGLVHGIDMYSGMIFQYACHIKNSKHRSCLDILAAGGRYDKLISSFRLGSMNDLGKDIVQSAVGVSIAIEKIALAELENEEFQLPNVTDVLVCSTGIKPMLKEKSALLRELWAAGVSASAVYDSTQSLEEVVDFCRENNVSSIFILKDTEPGIFKVRTIEKEKIGEKKVNISELSDFIPKLLSCKNEQIEYNQSTRMETLKGFSSTGSFSGSSVKITFVPLERLSSTSRKRYESQIVPQLTTMLQYFSSKTEINVLALELSILVIKTIASYLEINSDELAFEESLGTIIEKHPRHRKYLIRLGDEVHELRFEKKCPVIVLYSLADNAYRVIM